MRLVSSYQATDMIGQREPLAVGLVPYTSNIDSVLTPDGPWQKAVAPESVRLTHFSRLVADATGVLALSANAQDNVTLIAAGEHTFGLSNPSTTENMYARLIDRKVNEALFAQEHPTNANDSTTQLRWLETWRAKQAGTPPLLLVGHGQHYPRLRRLARLFDMSDVMFVDAVGVITELSDDDKEVTDAMQLSMAFRDNLKYENKALQWVRRTARFGAWATQHFFQKMSVARTPNVVDATRTDNGYSFNKAISARARVRQLQREASV